MLLVTGIYVIDGCHCVVDGYGTNDLYTVVLLVERIVDVSLDLWYFY